MMLPRLTLLAAVAALLVACGGSDDRLSRGALIDPPKVVATLSTAQIDAMVANNGLQGLTGAAQCDVKVIALNYATIGARSERTNASGVLLAPTGEPGSACAIDPAPLVAYARGTDANKSRALADPADPETGLLVAFLAAQGYAVVATDYLGYAESDYPFHPYLHADSEATSVIDSVRAARHARAEAGLQLSGKVMFSGYSQGGHASMASQRAAEGRYTSEINVVAGAHLAGPYNLGQALSLPTPTAGAQLFLPFIVTAWQQVYGNIYNRPSDAFQPAYADSIATWFPTTDVTSLYTQLRMDLPAAEALDLIMQPAFMDGVRGQGDNPLYQAGVRNSFLGWTPKTPVLLCGGAGDPVVPPAVHQDPLKADLDARGVENVASVDVDDAIQAVFGPAPVDPATPEFATYYGNYHGSYEPPFCLAAARELFDAVR